MKVTAQEIEGVISELKAHIVSKGPEHNHKGSCEVCSLMASILENEKVYTAFVNGITIPALSTLMPAPCMQLYHILADRDPEILNGVDLALVFVFLVGMKVGRQQMQAEQLGTTGGLTS